MLKPGGLYSMIYIKADRNDRPMGTFLYLISLMHCLPLGLDGQGAGLGMIWGRQLAQEILEQAGFPEVCWRWPSLPSTCSGSAVP